MQVARRSQNVQMSAASGHSRERTRDLRHSGNLPNQSGHEPCQSHFDRDRKIFRWSQGLQRSPGEARAVEFPPDNTIDSRIGVILRRFRSLAAVCAGFSSSSRQAGGGLALWRKSKRDARREVPLRHETQQLQRGETEHAKHQVAHHLDRSAHPHGPDPAMVVFQSAVDPPGRAAFTVANLCPPCGGLTKRCRFASCASSCFSPGVARGLVSMIGT